MAYTSLMFHLTFSTKERKHFLRPGVRPRVCEYLGGIARAHDAQMLAAGGWDDHVHMALALSPRYSISDMVRLLKANSSKWIHETMEDLSGFAWQDGYGAFSVSKSAMPRVVQYIQGQDTHHQSASFEEEFLALLEKHGIEFDPKYIWV